MGLYKDHKVKLGTTLAIESKDQAPINPLSPYAKPSQNPMKPLCGLYSRFRSLTIGAFIIGMALGLGLRAKGLEPGDRGFMTEGGVQ